MFLNDIKHTRNEMDQITFIKEISDNISGMEEVVILFLLFLFIIVDSEGCRVSGAWARGLQWVAHGAGGEDQHLPGQRHPQHGVGSRIVNCTNVSVIVSEILSYPVFTQTSWF